ncbi:MAG: hypothetical protein AB8F74_04150 [Saprospiraceae bacterium]
MMDELKHLYARFNYTDDKGFIVTVPTGKNKEHLSLGFDNSRREFNIHITDDSILEKGAKRRSYIFTLSAFRFFLLIKRFEQVFIHSFLSLILSSKTNLGKLKKNGFMFFDIEDTEECKQNFLNITKRGKKMKFNKDLDFGDLEDTLKTVSQFAESKNNFVTIFKFQKGQLLKQGYLFKFEKLNGLYFVPNKKFNRFNKILATHIYNYLNYYPLESTLELRKILFERLKNTFS